MPQVLKGAFLGKIMGNYPFMYSCGIRMEKKVCMYIYIHIYAYIYIYYMHIYIYICDGYIMV